MDTLLKKLRAVINEDTPDINPKGRIDLTTPPSHPRVSFPFPDITPYAQVLNRRNLARRLGIPVELIKREISQQTDVSSSHEGVCQVTPVYLVTNSHAGPHADQPSHWLAKPPFNSFDYRQYSGSATVFDLTEYLQKDKAITQRIIEEHAESTKTDLKSIGRLVVRTYHKTPTEWDSNFAYLSIQAANFLGRLPNLVLFATDAPSVDHPEASPIHKRAHGGLWTGRVAIIEGYESDKLPKRRKTNGVIETTLLKTPGVNDAHYAVIKFYPI